MRIGFFGGTFNPIHRGHLVLAQKAIDALQLDSLQWIPANPWQKNAQKILPACDRVAMIEDAIRDNPKMSVNTLEISSNQPSFSIDTLRVLAAHFPHDERFYLIGADQWENFHTWKDWDKLFDLATLVVFSRKQKLQQTSPSVAQFIQENHPDILFIEMPQCPVSSSELRMRIKKEGVDSEYCRQWLLPSTREFLRDCLHLLPS